MKKYQEKGPSFMKRLKDKLPRIHMCFKHHKNRIGKVAFVIVPLAIAVCGASIGVYLTENKGKGPLTSVEVVTNKVNRRIYLVSSDELTIPLTVGLNKRATTHEEMVEVFSLLKSDSKANTQSIKGLIPKETKLKSIELFENELMLDVSSEFLNYDVKDENKLLESIVYTYSEFDGVEMVTLYVEGERLTSLPKNKTVVPMCMTKELGINRESKNAHEVSGKKMINVYYQKTIDSKNYLVPVSQYVDENDTLERQFTNAINATLNEERGLKPLSNYSMIANIQEDSDENKFVLNLKEEALLEEGVIKRELYDLVSLTLDDLVEAKEVSFVIDSEVMLVEGLLSPETYEVSSYIFNQVEI